MNLIEFFFNFENVSKLVASEHIRAFNEGINITEQDRADYYIPQSHCVLNTELPKQSLLCQEEKILVMTLNYILIY